MLCEDKTQRFPSRCPVCNFQIIIDEVVEWLPPPDVDIPSLDEMQSWKEVGPVRLCSLIHYGLA